MQISSGNAGYKASYNVYQDKTPVENKCDNSNEIEPAEMNDILAALANVATQRDRTIATTLQGLTNTLQALKDKVDGIDQAGKERKKNNNSKFYCWTHGRTRNKNHTSGTCINKKEGHKEDATLDNRKGGSNKYCNDQE